MEGGPLIEKSGIGVALKRQKRALDLEGIEYSTNPWSDYDIIHINTILPLSFFHALLAKARGKKVILHAHTLMEDTKNSFSLINTFSPAIRTYLELFYGGADHIICPSEYAKNCLLDYGVCEGKISPLSNGVELKDYEFSERGRVEYRERYGLKDLVPFSVGHVFPRKGVSTFVNVAKEMKDVQFVWFGNIFDRITVSDKAVRNALGHPPKNLQFTGYVDDILAAYSAGDIFFFPTTAETQGIVILEAWAMGRPVLTRDLPVFSDWTKPGKDCLVAKDDEEFKEKLSFLMEDEKLREKLVKGGKRAVEGHRMERIGECLREIYGGVIDEG